MCTPSMKGMSQGSVIPSTPMVSWIQRKLKKDGTHEIIIVIVLKVEQFGLMMQ